jgi:hypothetical protein
VGAVSTPTPEDATAKEAASNSLHTKEHPVAKDAGFVSPHKPQDSPARDAAPISPDRKEKAVARDKLDRRVRVEFTARQEVMEKLERVRAIASYRLPARPSIEQLIDFMADYVIHREDPIRRHERRQARQLKREKAPG